MEAAPTQSLEVPQLGVRTSWLTLQVAPLGMTTADFSVTSALFPGLSGPTGPPAFPTVFPSSSVISTPTKNLDGSSDSLVMVTLGPPLAVQSSILTSLRWSRAFTVVVVAPAESEDPLEPDASAESDPSLEPEPSFEPDDSSPPVVAAAFA